MINPSTQSGMVSLNAGPYTIQGVSVAGVYTSPRAPELGVVLDAGVPLRSFAGTDRIFLSHAHADHAAGLASLLSIRNLVGRKSAQLHLPEELVEELSTALGSLSRMHRAELQVDFIPMAAGATLPLVNDLHVRAFRTHHPVASLGFQFLRRVRKLRAEFLALPGAEIAQRRKNGDTTLFEETDHLELAYATDTLSRVLTTSPTLLQSRVLILECTYLDQQHTVADARQRAHIHLDELLERAGEFQNEHLVLMHFSQTHQPSQVHAILREKLAPRLKPALHIFAPESGEWFG